MTKPSNTNRAPTQGEIWKDWAVKAQNGDKRAYRDLLNDIAPYIRNYLIGGLANPDWADDVTQDVLISVHKSLATYSADRPFKPWLMAIVGFRRTDFLRKHYRSRDNKNSPLDDPSVEKEHVTNPAHAGEYKDIEAALQDLPEKQRKVFQLMKIEGFTAKEVAKKTGMSVAAVKVSAHRTMKKLKDQLG